MEGRLKSHVKQANHLDINSRLFRFTPPCAGELYRDKLIYAGNNTQESCRAASPRQNLRDD